MVHQIEQSYKQNSLASMSYLLSPAAMSAAQHYRKEINKLEESIYGVSKR